MNTQQADRLTRHCTVYATFCELKRAMQGGYCPTIRPRDKRHVALAALVRASGFKVFDGLKVS